MAEQTEKKARDPRHIITPDAFAVADDLLGLPLATPKKRGLAMLLDLIIIQQLTQAGSTLLGLAIVVVLFLLSRSKGRKSVGSSRTSIFKVMALLLFLYITAVEVIQYVQTDEFSLMNHETTLVENDESDEIDESSDMDDIFEAIAKKFGYGFGWAGVYFTLFTYLLRGQTPGKFLMRIRVIQLDGQKLSLWNSFGRYGGYAASVVTGLTGFLQIYWDPNRQGLHDKVSSTVVINT
ncbi:MAG: hypothetical protein DRQ47_11315 [Gammaproteobacteria bacterium]|nr:MAG: hypothetical protein DRQ47_11315 [Gammaproteobacteria bacterium]